MHEKLRSTHTHAQYKVSHVQLVFQQEALQVKDSDM